jgi:hypothetical protein
MFIAGLDYNMKNQGGVTSPATSARALLLVREIAELKTKQDVLGDDHSLVRIAEVLSGCVGVAVHQVQAPLDELLAASKM